MKLLPKAARDLRRAAALTRPFCDRCSGPAARCCSAVFCAAAERGLELAGLPVPKKPWGHGVPFLDPEEGCVLPPEHRPGCAGIGCDQVPDDVRAAATRLVDGAVVACPTVRVLVDAASTVSRALLQAELLKVPALRRACGRLS